MVRGAFLDDRTSTNRGDIRFLYNSAREGSSAFHFDGSNFVRQVTLQFLSTEIKAALVASSLLLMASCANEAANSAQFAENGSATAMQSDVSGNRIDVSSGGQMSTETQTDAEPAFIAEYGVAGEGSPSGMTGIGGGTLSIERGCVTINNTSGILVVPVFKAGTATWDGDNRMFRYLGKSSAIGSRVELTGGALPETLKSRLPFSDIIKRCGNERIFLVAG